MFVLHSTKKLLGRIGQSTVGPERMSSTTRMGDWTALRGVEALTFCEELQQLQPIVQGEQVEAVLAIDTQRLTVPR